MRVLLTGATGFVGSHILRRLLAERHYVRAVVRDPARLSLKHPALEAAPGDVVSGSGLADAAQGCEAVIHLVGIIMEVGTQTFERVHFGGTVNVLRAAQAAGVRRFVQMSALGVRADGVSGYQTTKWSAEEEVRRSGIPHVILRPSLIFGPGDGFVSQMVDVMRSAPLLRPVPGSGKFRFRPVYIDDVAACFVSALTNENATGQTVDLVGGEELTLEELLAAIAQCIGVRKPAVHVPLPLMFAGAAVLGKLLPKPPVTTDQLRMLREGSTSDPGKMKSLFGLEPAGFREGLRRYLCASAGATSDLSGG